MRDGICRGRGRSSETFVRLRFKKTRMEISDRGSSLHNGTLLVSGSLQPRNERTNHLVFRALSIENGQEELTVSVLTFGELESGKDLSKRWR